MSEYLYGRVSDLSGENERLRQRIADLEAWLKMALEDVAQMEYHKTQAAAFEKMADDLLVENAKLREHGIELRKWKQELEVENKNLQEELDFADSQCAMYECGGAIPDDGNQVVWINGWTGEAGSRIIGKEFDWSQFARG